MGKESNLDRYFKATSLAEVTRCIGIINVEAGESFLFSEPAVRDRAAFRELVGNYVIHHTQYTLGYELPLFEAHAIGMDFLNNTPGRYESSVRAGISAWLGGAWKILGTLNEALKEQQVEAFFVNELDKHIDPSDMGSIIVLMREFVRKQSGWGKSVDFIPNGETLAKRYGQVLRSHSKAAEQLSLGVWMEMTKPLSGEASKQRFSRHWER